MRVICCEEENILPLQIFIIITLTFPRESHLNVVTIFQFSKNQGVNNQFGGSISPYVNLILCKLDLTKLFFFASDLTRHQKTHKIIMFSEFFECSEFSEFFNVQKETVLNQ